jgi:hypothetical protein
MVAEMALKQESKTPQVYYIKGFLRYEDELEQGVYEVTLNSNYFAERQLKDVQATVTDEKVRNVEIKRVSYQNFDFNRLGFLFYGRNLDLKSLDLLLRSSLKPVSYKLIHIEF